MENTDGRSHTPGLETWDGTTSPGSECLRNLYYPEVQTVNIIIHHSGIKKGITQSLNFESSVIFDTWTKQLWSVVALNFLIFLATFF